MRNVQSFESADGSTLEVRLESFLKGDDSSVSWTARYIRDGAAGKK